MWLEVIISGSPRKTNRRGRWQEEASSRGFPKAKAHTDPSNLVVTIGWILRNKQDLVRNVCREVRIIGGKTHGGTAGPRDRREGRKQKEWRQRLPDRQLDI